MATQIVTNETINWLSLIGSPLLIMVVLFPLFVIGAFGAGDIKLLGVVSIVFGFKNTMIIFCYSVICGAVIGILKVIKYRDLGERFRCLYQYSNRLITSLRMRRFEVLEESYIDGLAENEVKRTGIHFSLPILLAVIIFLLGGGR